MPFAEREPFVHSGVRSDDLAWNKPGTSFGMKLWQRSHVAGWRSTSSNTHRGLAPTWEWVLKHNGDVTPITTLLQLVTRCRAEVRTVKHELWTVIWRVGDILVC